MNLSHRIKQTRLYLFLDRIFRSHLTESGRTMFWLVAISTGLSLFSFVIKAYILWCGLISACFFSIAAARISRPHLLVQLEAPERTRAGHPFRLSLSCTNLSSKPAKDLRVLPVLPLELQPLTQASYVMKLDPGATYRFSQEIYPQRRGVYRLQRVEQQCCFPFSLWNDLYQHSCSHQLIVTPDFHPLESLDVPVGMKYQPGGLALTSYHGDSTEFLSTREFRPGDPLRSIHWRSWARLGIPIVKEHGEEFFCRLALIVDTYLPDPAYPQLLEKGISLAAAITDLLAREEYVIDLFAAGDRLYSLQAGRSLAYLENILDLLACLEPCPEPEQDPFHEMESVLSQELEGISTVLLVLTHWDPKRAILLESLSQNGVAVKAYLIHKEEAEVGELPETVRPLPETHITAGGLSVL